jgi:hypothetical protein
MPRPLWEIQKDTTHGTSYALHVGIPGVPGTATVTGLSRDQGAELGTALTLLEERAANRALDSVRIALGIQQR